MKILVVEVFGSILGLFGLIGTLPASIGDLKLFTDHSLVGLLMVGSAGDFAASSSVQAAQAVVSPFVH